MKQNHIRKFLLITLSHVEKRDIKKQDVCLIIQQLFECVSIVVAVEEQNCGKHFHAAVLNKNASKNTAMKKIRAVFSEFDGRQCNVQFHKGWGYLCAYITKQEDKQPLVWGMFSREQIRDIARNAQRKKKLLKTSQKKPCFLVAGLETLISENIHQAYAAGFMKVRPNSDLDPDSIETYYSEDYFHMPSFLERSTKLLYDFVCRIAKIAAKEKSILTIYFHNFSRFSGIILLRHIVCHHKSYELKPLTSNHRLYELVIKSQKNVSFRFRDSLNLLPGKLGTLAQNLCRPKGSIDHDKVNLVRMKESYLTYLKQDILLLGGVMKQKEENREEEYF